MDPVSQAALGAVVGQITGYRRLGPRAAAVGAMAGVLPDIDVLFSINGSYFDQLVTHRGITHSLFFAPVVGPALGWCVWRWQTRQAARPPPRADLGRWILVVCLALLSHPLLDYLTPYGTQLLLPFSNARFAIAAMPIIDPIYTALLLGGLLCSRLVPARTVLAAVLTLSSSCAYLGYGWYLNHAAAAEARQQLMQQGISNVEVAAFPTLLQVHQRRVVARTPSVDRVGFISMWHPCDIDWGTAARAQPEAVDAFLALPEGRIFSWFTMGWIHYTRDNQSDTAMVHASDLRYGSTTDPKQSFFGATLHRDASAPPRVSAGRRIPAGMRLTQLLEDAYAPICRITGQLQG